MSWVTIPEHRHYIRKTETILGRPKWMGARDCQTQTITIFVGHGIWDSSGTKFNAYIS
jgi:hypothetical protein